MIDHRLIARAGHPQPRTSANDKALLSSPGIRSAVSATLLCAFIAASAALVDAATPPAFFPEGRFEERLTIGDAYGHTALHTLLPLGLGVAALSWDKTRPAGAALAGYGLLVGPSMGHFYLGQAPVGWSHLNQRASGLGLIGGGLLLGLIGMVEAEGNSRGVGYGLMALGAASVVGGGGWLGHTFYQDVAALDHSHARYLARAVDAPGLTFHPTVKVEGESTATAFGAQVNLRL